MTEFSFRDGGSGYTWKENPLVYQSSLLPFANPVDFGYRAAWF